MIPEDKGKCVNYNGSEIKYFHMEIVTFEDFF